MELDRGESQFGKFGEFCLQVDRLTGFRTIGIRSGMNVPGAYRKLEFAQMIDPPTFLFRDPLPSCKE